MSLALALRIVLDSCGVVPLDEPTRILLCTALRTEAAELETAPFFEVETLSSLFLALEGTSLSS